ncbi:unnamed protein product [Taenia asiatica]|uniref:Uncharacterized protein n=1 Tax=Taenia asiatica TaxID=60517 RepID=A0A0R3WBF9_TAEAS|nr:unnamed protein product [Taenia asiatica]
MSPSAPRLPPSAAATSSVSPIPLDRSRPIPNKRTSRLFCSMRKTSKSRRDPGSSPMRSPGWDGDGEILTRDDPPPISPTPISGFASLKKHKTRARPTIPLMESSDFTSELYSTIRRRKSERGKNYNPMDPAFQQTSFRGTASMRRTRTNRLGENPDGTSPESDMNPKVPDSQPLTKESPV